MDPYGLLGDLETGPMAGDADAEITSEINQNVLYFDQNVLYFDQNVLYFAP